MGPYICTVRDTSLFVPCLTHIMCNTWVKRNTHISCVCNTHGVATISKLLQIIGLCCKRALQKRQYSAKETSNCKEPTNHSHPIGHIHGREKFFVYVYETHTQPWVTSLKHTQIHENSIFILFSPTHKNTDTSRTGRAFSYER